VWEPASGKAKPRSDGAAEGGGNGGRWETSGEGEVVKHDLAHAFPLLPSRLSFLFLLSLSFYFIFSLVIFGKFDSNFVFSMNYLNSAGDYILYLMALLEKETLLEE
jgi:hypothetical protein